MHKPIEATKLHGTARYHYKSWSHCYHCPTCNREGRFNKNYLGQRTVFCDGVKFTKVKTFAEKRRLDDAYQAAMGAGS